MEKWLFHFFITLNWMLLCHKQTTKIMSRQSILQREAKSEEKHNRVSSFKWVPAIYNENSRISISSSCKHFIQNPSPFQTLKIPPQNSSVFKDLQHPCKILYARANSRKKLSFASTVRKAKVKKRSDPNRSCTKTFLQAYWSGMIKRSKEMTLGESNFNIFFFCFALLIMI